MKRTTSNRTVPLDLYVDADALPFVRLAIGKYLAALPATDTTQAVALCRRHLEETEHAITVYCAKLAIMERGIQP